MGYSLIVAEHRRCACNTVRKIHRGYVLFADTPTDERPREAAGCRTSAQPEVDVRLLTFTGRFPTNMQPFKESSPAGGSPPTPTPTQALSRLATSNSPFAWSGAATGNPSTSLLDTCCWTAGFENSCHRSWRDLRRRTAPPRRPPRSRGSEIARSPCRRQSPPSYHRFGDSGARRCATQVAI